MQSASTRGFEGLTSLFAMGSQWYLMGYGKCTGWPARTFRFQTMDTPIMTGYHGWECCRHSKCHTDNEMEVKNSLVKPVFGLYLFCPLVMRQSVAPIDHADFTDVMSMLSASWLRQLECTQACHGCHLPAQKVIVIAIRVHSRQI